MTTNFDTAANGDEWTSWQKSSHQQLSKVILIEISNTKQY